MRRGLESGEFHVSDKSLARFALLAMCNGVVSWYSPRGRLSIDEIARHFIAMAYGIVGYSSSSGKESSRKKV